MAGCVPTARVILPTSAAVARDVQGPPLEVGAVIGDDEKAANPFTADDMVPCKDDEDRAAARVALGNVSTQIYALGESSTNEERDKALASLTALLKTPCFELAAADLSDRLVFDSALALKTWWSEGRAEQAVAEYVEVDQHFAYITLPASPRHSLLRAGRLKHPLAPLLCPDDDGDCGRETAGWIARAEDHFQHRPISGTDEDCEKDAYASDPVVRWSQFRSCKGRKADTQTAFPLGRFRAMTDGWLVISNPWSSCGSLSMYDLANGTFVETSSCGRGSNVEMGRVPLATIREAAWILAIANYMDASFRPSDQYAVPPGIVPGRPREEDGTGHGSLHGGRRPRRTLWTWYRPQNGKLVGQVTGMFWDEPAHEASNYASDLYRLAEGSVVKGCTPAYSATTLASFAWDKPGPFVREDAELVPFDWQAPSLVAARNELSRAKAPSRCTVPM